jgi:hypothetical protein
MALRDYLDPSGRMLARRLDELCSTLENLASRLHGTIANAIGETIGSIVRDTALRALNEVMRLVPSNAPMPSRPTVPHDYTRDDRGYWGDEDDFEPDVDEQSTSEKPERLPTALSAGLQAASWWLQRCPRRIVSTFAVALMAAGIAYVGGPLAVVVLGLAGTATQFNSLAEAISAGASTLGLFDPPGINSPSFR